jgi:nucleoprotein TPR
MAAAAVDVGYLAASYSVPASTLQSLLASPTVELVQALLVQIEAKARQYDDLKSEKLRSDLELENTIRGNESRQKALKATADKALKEAEELRQKLAEQGKCIAKLYSSRPTLLMFLPPQKRRANSSRRSFRTSSPRRPRPQLKCRRLRPA